MRTVAALIDAVAAPEPPLPPVAATDAEAAFATWLAFAPRLNRAGFRAVIALLRLARFGARDRAGRLAVLRRLGPLEQALRSAAAVSYYGDATVLRVLGVDPSARVREALARRAAA